MITLLNILGMMNRVLFDSFDDLTDVLNLSRSYLGNTIVKFLFRTGLFFLTEFELEFRR